MNGGMKRFSRHGKANLRVRLFLFAILATTGMASAGELEVPPTWSEALQRFGEPGDWGRNDPIPAYERELVARIRDHLLATSRKEAGEFADYDGTVPTSKASYGMVAIKGGTFRMGSPDSESGRKGDEEQREVTVSSFWMGRHEVTWALYLPFADAAKRSPRRFLNGAPREGLPNQLLDWISSPTEYYTSPDFGMGLDGDYPAIGMTQHAANKFCQWLSLQTGHFYRLPTEAEWEYACRAGTEGPYSCPVNQLENHAVIDPTQTRTGYERVGTKTPNPWGLFDMHGNVWEWCLDGYTSTRSYRLRSDPWIRAKQRYPRVARGGSWYDLAEDARSARRLFSHPNWNIQDPQEPQSLWWLVDAQWLGFRIVRPLEIPGEEDLYEAWNTGAMHRQENDVIP